MVRQALLSSDGGSVDGQRVCATFSRPDRPRHLGLLALADDGVDMLGPQVSTLMQGTTCDAGSVQVWQTRSCWTCRTLPALSEPATVTLKAAERWWRLGRWRPARRRGLRSSRWRTRAAAREPGGLAARGRACVAFASPGLAALGDQPDGDLDVEIRAPPRRSASPVVEVTLTAVVAGSWTVDVGCPGATAEPVRRADERIACRMER